MDKVALLQNYSNNNHELMLKTLRNHASYCNKWKYDLILENRPYSKFMDFNSVAKQLETHDVVVTIGSDCVFTNFSRNIADYAMGMFSICEERTPCSRLNGEVLLFRNMHDARIWDVLSTLEREQSVVSGHYGFQSCCNEHIGLWDFMSIIPIEDKVQGFEPSYVPQESAWTQEHIVYHAFGGSDKLGRICAKEKGFSMLGIVI